MKKFPKPINEVQRLQSLHKLGILDTSVEDRFDRITHVASALFNVPIALISLVDAKRQWFKSCIGLVDTEETGRDVSFCSHAILHNEVFVIEDARKDKRFADNALVTGYPHIRFYAGAPLHTVDNTRPGTLCIIDTKPRKFSEKDRRLLADIAKWVEREMNLEDTNALVFQLEEQAKDLQYVKNRLEIVTKAGEIGVWEWNIPKNTLEWDQTMYQLYGYKSESGREPYTTWEDSIHPDDKERTVKLLYGAVNGKNEYDTTFRIILPTGEQRYIRAFGEVTKNANGDAYKMIGVNFDVTDVERLQRARTDFVSLVSHELKSPIAAFRMGTERLEQELHDICNEEQLTYIAQLKDMAEDMMQYVRTLLNITRSNLGQYPVQRTTVDIKKVLQEVREDVELSQRLHCSIKMTTSKSLSTIQADKDILSIIVKNFISNAVKYATPNSTVQVKVRKGDKQSLEISVHNEGKPIPKKVQQKLFTEISPDESKENSHGLGLYLCGRLARAAGCKVSFSSTKEDGTTFVLRIPKDGMRGKENT